VGESGVWVHNSCGAEVPYKTKYGKPHKKPNVKHNNAIEDELDAAVERGSTNPRKNKSQVDVEGNVVSGRKPDASYVENGQRHNTNYVSNHTLDNTRELNRELNAWKAIRESDPNAVNSLRFNY
jgi:hypothetical protein